MWTLENAFMVPLALVEEVQPTGGRDWLTDSASRSQIGKAIWNFSAKACAGAEATY
jgi:hypothetical protein